MANDFSGDGTYKLLYNLESGALTTDSIGSNTLTDEGGVTANTTDYKQGSASGDFESGSAQCLYCADGDLDSGVPLKSGESNNALMDAFWCQFESIPADISLMAKYDHWNDERTFRVKVESTDDELHLVIGYNSGASFEDNGGFGTSFVTGRFYHIGIDFDGSDGSYRVRIWDDTAGALLGSDDTGTFSNSIYLGDAPWGVGSHVEGGASPSFSNPHDGEIDECVMADEKKGASVIDEIRQGIFGAVEAISTEDVSSDTSIENAILTRLRELANQDLGALSEITDSIITRTRVLAESDPAASSEITDAILTLTRELSENDISSSTSIISSILTLTRELSEGDVQSSTSITDAIINTFRNLSVNAASLATEVINSSLDVIRGVSEDDILSDISISNVNVTRLKELLNNDINCQIQLTNIILSLVRALTNQTVISETSITGVVLSVIAALDIYRLNVKAERDGATNITASRKLVKATADRGLIGVTFS